MSLRKQSKLVRQGTFELLLPESEELFVYERELDGQKMLVVCNFTDHDVAYQMPATYGRAALVQEACNYADAPHPGTVRPYEAFALLLG